MKLDKKNVYVELHEQARNEDTLINARFAIFFTANAFVFSGFISFIFNENCENDPIKFSLIIVPFMFLQFSNYFYFNYILPAQVSLKYLWGKIKFIEDKEKWHTISTFRVRTNYFKAHRTISRFPYTSFTRIVSICWLIVIIICINKITQYILLGITSEKNFIDKSAFSSIIHVIFYITIFYLTTEIIILISKYYYLKNEQKFIEVILPEMSAYILSIAILIFSYYLLNNGYDFVTENYTGFINTMYISMYMYFYVSIYFIFRLINFAYEIFFKIIAYFDYLKSGKNEYISSILHHLFKVPFKFKKNPED